MGQSRNMGNNDHMYQELLKLEKRFACNHYHGKGEKDFVVCEGTIPIMISAPHAVNHTREGQLKYADKFTGAFALLLHSLTGCHIIYSARHYSYDPNYDASNAYQLFLQEYIKQHHIEVLIDLHGAKEERNYAIEIGTAPDQNAKGQDKQNTHPALHGRDFICDLVSYSFDYVLQNIHQPEEKKRTAINQIFSAGTQNTITKFISKHTTASCLQLEINGIYRSLEHKDELIQCVKGLGHIISILDKIDWQSPHIRVYKLWQSNTHKPQDKVEIDIQEETNVIFNNGRSYSICSFAGEPELVKIHDSNPKLREQLQNRPNYICLTNRLIESVCGRGWTSTGEDTPPPRNAPIVLYENTSFLCEIGLPSADCIDDVTFSSALYSENVPYASSCYFAVYNKYTDSMYYVDFSKADYKDNGRVKTTNGNPAKKVMLPRYYKRLLGYLDEPFTMIRQEEYEQFQDIEAFAECYDKLQGESYYVLRPDSKTNQAARKIITDTLKQKGAYNHIELIRIPKTAPKQLSFNRRILTWLNNLNEKGLTFVIGKSEYLLETEWTTETDDKNNVARLSANMMSMLGVVANDKIIIKFKETQVTLRVLEKADLLDYQIGIPAPTRKKLGMNSINEIVRVHRDMRHTLMRNSQAQIIAILGTLLAVFQITKDRLSGIIICLIFIPLMLIFILNEERIKVK